MAYAISLDHPHAKPLPNRQPQDSQSELLPQAPKSSAFFALSKEPEDARLTGGTRSLDRRLLALNLS